METKTPMSSSEPIDYAYVESETGYEDTNSKQYRVIRRNGQLTHFNVEKIITAITKAFFAVEGANHLKVNSNRVHNTVNRLTQQVLKTIDRKSQENGTVHIEDIQDQVELALMRAGEHKVARAYVLYREEHAQQRAEKKEKKVIHVIDKKGNLHPLDEEQIYTSVVQACTQLDNVQVDAILEESLKNLFDGISERDVQNALIMSVRTLIEKEPNYTYVAARLLLELLKDEMVSLLQTDDNYPDYFKQYVHFGIEHELLDPKLAEFDLEKLGNALVPERDLQFNYLGLQILYDRYLLHWEETRFELPQAFFMRVAMGLALNEDDRETQAIAFYNLLSNFDFMSSTPTLFNAGTLRPQLSSCYISTVPDSAECITKAIADNALLSKYAGGIGNDWAQIRGMGAHIKGTNGKSQGVIPFMKMAEAGLIAFNQSGRRRGSGCAFLPTWHIDIDEFLELRKNTGDHRRRTHDMNTANWIQDEFMRRVHENGEWTLFSPDEVTDLHNLYGSDFSEAYHRYEQLADEGKIKLFKRVSAIELWRKMLTMLFETGHPWICFSDPCNIRNPQQHTGQIHSSNLCTEIALNTNESEVAVCNLASINLANHIIDGQLDKAKLTKTIQIGMRMLDNVIDINFYPIPEARDSNSKHRPVGLGLMGFQDALYKLRIPFASKQAVDFSDETMEFISYQAILASTHLAQERGKYKTFDGSLWSQGILPIDSIAKLKESRGEYLEMSTDSTLDWDSLRKRVKTVGMRNSNTMAIAPTATISSVCGVSQSIEPNYQNLFVKTNLSGDFTVINPYLVNDLKALGLWDEVMMNDLKYFDGSIHAIERVPAELKALYLQAFEIEPSWIVELASRRQKWIDQSQSVNLYLSEPSGRKLDSLYKLAWIRGLKTTYYLRTLGATHVEKNTLSTDKLVKAQCTVQTCSMPDPSDIECEACQ
jgi:ribonucleoside-diphosphate reductase alpha chain